ncbi:MAG: transglycosylase domain-containing protein [Maricaulaceae bacterium]
MRRKAWVKNLRWPAMAAVSSALLLGGITYAQLKPVPKSLYDITAQGEHLQLLDRRGTALNITYQNDWNTHSQAKLHDIPAFLKTAFIAAEDKRFYDHGGADWAARFSAVGTNLKARRAVRGASTITEQSLRMIRPRPRTVWSRWIEGFEAGRLERAFSKDEIFEFYLNQVPYTANRRGVVQAASYYFDRDLETLSHKEMLALAVLVRAPSRMDLWKDTARVEGRIERLANILISQDRMTKTQKIAALAEELTLNAPALPHDARNFVGHVKRRQDLPQHKYAKLGTTLDSDLQRHAQSLLDKRLSDLKPKQVENGAVLAVNHQSGEILIWAVGGSTNEDTPGRFIDTVLAPRQPGSALKPFVYARALEKGWSAATIIDDSPLTEAVGNGLHSYQNYSRSFYGPISLRQALGNSLNIPALKALQFVGSEDYLSYLARFGFSSLANHPNFYGDGIALGNGEVSLYELVQAYSAIANQGLMRPLTPFTDSANEPETRRVMPSDIASLIGHILSDENARQFEFGQNSVLNLPVQTAVKTGTSSDYRDSWAIGFNHRYTVGVWMGNLDQKPTDGVTGATGPALLLRSVFSRLNKSEDTRPLILDKRLIHREICAGTGRLKSKTQICDSYAEWFVPGTEPSKNASLIKQTAIRLRRPVHNLHIAYDPRLPAKDQAFEFLIQGIEETDKVTWKINDTAITKNGSRYDWPLVKGTHIVSASVQRDLGETAQIKPVRFIVK